MKKNRLFFILSIFSMIASCRFFYCTLFPAESVLVKVVYYMIFALMTVVVINRRILSYDRVKLKANVIPRNNNFRFVGKSINILFVLLFISVFNASFFKDQSISISLMTSLPIILCYLYFYEFRYMNITLKQVETLIILFSLLYIIADIVGHLTLPDPLFGSVRYERGLYRFSLPGVLWLVFSFFYLIKKYKSTKSIKYIVFLAIVYLFIILTGTRQYILYSSILGVLYFLRKSSFITKAFVFALLIVAYIYVIPKITIFNELQEVSQEQIYNNQNKEEDRRIRDYRYFVFDAPKNVFQTLFGCGMVSMGNSAAGEEMARLVEDENLIMADAGWAGYIYLYGFVATFVLLYLYLRLLTIKLPSNCIYIKYFIVYIILCSITSGCIIYDYEYMISLIIFYILSKSNRMHLNIEHSKLR